MTRGLSPEVFVERLSFPEEYPGHVVGELPALRMTDGRSDKSLKTNRVTKVSLEDSAPPYRGASFRESWGHNDVGF